MLLIKDSNKFHFLPIGIFVGLLGLYFCLSLSSFAHIQIDRLAYLILCIVMSMLYLLNYRRDSLFCYETFFYFLYILCVFFSDIVLENLGVNDIVSSVYYTTFSKEIENKGIIVQMLGFFGFMAAASYNNTKNIQFKNITKWKSKSSIFTSVNLNKASNIIGVVVALYLLYLYFSGIISSWFHYFDNASNYTNIEIVYITTLCLSLTTIELTRLNRQGCYNFKDFIRRVNKICLIDIALISVLLLISGNRNECLLILLPAIVAYSSLIKPLSNVQSLVGIAAGVTAMVFIGVIRQFGYQASSDMEFGFFEATRDFGLIDPNTRFLIEYVDNHGAVYFNNAFLNLVSTVPFLGGIVANIFGLSYVTRSTQITTDGMQLANNMDSGLGTSLIGDLYYTCGIVFVVLFMLWFGWFVSSMHNRFVIKKNYNTWLFVLYCFNFANVVYFIRAEWTMPFRYIGFTFLIILVITKICTKRK